MGHLRLTAIPLGTILHLVRTYLLWQMTLLAVIKLAWRLTDWHTTSTYGSALINAGEMLVGLATLSLLGISGDRNMHLTEDEVEMRGWDRHGTRRFASLTRPWHPGIWMMGLGFVTALIGLALN